MVIAAVAVLIGLLLLIWGADRFVDGAASTSRHLGMPPLLIGMVVLGFGTSAPEMMISAIAAWQGSPGIALGNAYGSNIANIALILGLTALLVPITVHSKVLRKELPILSVLTALAVWQVSDGQITRAEGVLLLGVFAILMTWTIVNGMRTSDDALGQEVERELGAHPMPLNRALLWLGIGLVCLVVGSRSMVWGSVEIATWLGVSETIIGLTIVALGTSLPELASSIAAVRKGEHDMALGNVLGSNLFNTLAVVGIAGVIHPMVVDPDIIYRDVPIMAALTLSLFVIGYGFRGIGRINRIEGSILVLIYIAYMTYLATTVLV
jgi:cation:H+ antiporter